MNNKFVLSLMLIFLISAVSALTVQVSTPATINSETTNFDITFSLNDYNSEHSFTADIYLDTDNVSGELINPAIKTGFNIINPENLQTYSLWDGSTPTDETNYFIYVKVIDTVSSAEAEGYSEGFLVDRTLPETATDLIATAGNGKIDLNWTASVSSDVKQYNVYRSITAGFTAGTGNLLWNTTQTNYSDSAVVFGTTYYYVIKTIDNAGNLSADSSEVNSASLDETPPETSIDYDGEWANQNPLTISISCEDTGSECKTIHYKLNENEWEHYSGKATSVQVNTEGINYLVVYSTDNADQNETDTNYTIKIDSVAPTDINDLNATADQLTINLSWTASTDVEGSGIKNYFVFRNGTLLTETTSNSFDDLGDHNTTYTYYVKAVDEAGNESNESNEDSATAMDTTGPSVSSNADSSWHKGTVTITITVSEPNYTLYYQINNGSVNNTTAINPAINFTAGAAEVIEGENSFKFWAVDDHNNTGNTETPTIKIDNSVPNAPSLSSPGANSNGEVSLSWNKPSDNPESNSGIKGYKIYRKTGSESYSVITTINDDDTTSYTDTGRSQGTTYYYKITAFDNLDQESDLSNSNEQQVTMPSDSTTTTSGDGVPPTVSWTAPSNGNTIKDINVTLKAYISDTSELKFISFTYKKSTETSYKTINTFQTNLFNGTKTVIWDTTAIENGEYDLKVLARDAPGNVNSKIITITLDRDSSLLSINDSNSDENKTELNLAEKAIENAKQSKNQAMDLIKYWKTFNLDFSLDEKVTEAILLLKKSETELNEEKLTECISDAKQAKKLFDEFSQTEVNTYKTQSMDSEKELDLSANLANENEKLKKEVETSREMQLIEIKHDGETFYQENIVLKIKNTSDKTKTIQLIEAIPKELIESADSIKSTLEFTVIEKDPVIKWEIELNAGEEKEIVYSLINKKLNKTEADQIIKSEIFFEGNPVILNPKTKIANENFASPTGLILLGDLLPAGITVLIIAVLIGAFLFLRSKNFSFGRENSEKETKSFDGLSGVYSSSNFRTKKTLRNNEPEYKKKVNPINSGESGGRFSYKGN